MPVFDDKTSFEVQVANGTVSIAPDALATVLNEYVFARNDAPMKDISIKIKGDRLVIKGKLHSKGDLPFETGGELGLNADGRLRLHSEKVKALHVPVKKVMSLMGIELSNVINTSKIPGMDTRQERSASRSGQAVAASPHPRKNHLRAARKERDHRGVRRGRKLSSTADRARATAQQPPTGPSATARPGSAGSPLWTPVARRTMARAGNYMVFRGNRVRFGKLTMENTDLTVIDLDPGDPLDWDQDSYQDQLVAGYSKSTIGLACAPTLEISANCRNLQSAQNLPGCKAKHTNLGFVISLLCLRASKHRNFGISAFFLSGKGFGGAGFGTAALPFVILAETALVLFNLPFNFRERLFADRAKVFIAGRGVKRSGGKREIQSECVRFGAGDFGKHRVQQDKIRLIGLQKRVQFGDGSFKLLVDRIVTLDIFETYGEFHMRTCRIS
jgi:hypothetical protein